MALSNHAGQHKHTTFLLLQEVLLICTALKGQICLGRSLGWTLHRSKREGRETSLRGTSFCDSEQWTPKRLPEKSSGNPAGKGVESRKGEGWGHRSQMIQGCLAFLVWTHRWGQSGATGRGEWHSRQNGVWWAGFYIVIEWDGKLGLKWVKVWEERSFMMYWK